MDIVVDESGVVDVVVYMLYHCVVDIIPHRLCQPHRVVDVVIDKGGVMNVGGEPSGIVDGVIDKQGVILRAIDIAGVVDIVVDIGRVVHILVHVCNQRVVDVVVDICSVMDVVVDVSGITHNLCNICCIVDIDSIMWQFSDSEGSNKVLTCGSDESQRVFLRAVAPPDKARPEIRDGRQGHSIARSVFSATRHSAKSEVISRNRDSGTSFYKVSKIAPILSILITRQRPTRNGDRNVHREIRNVNT